MSESKWIHIYNEEVDKIEDYRFKWKILTGTTALIVDMEKVTEFLDQSYSPFLSQKAIADKAIGRRKEDEKVLFEEAAVGPVKEEEE